MRWEEVPYGRGGMNGWEMRWEEVPYGRGGMNGWEMRWEEVPCGRVGMDGRRALWEGLCVGGSLTWTLLSSFDGGTEALAEGVASVPPASGSSCIKQTEGEEGSGGRDEEEEKDMNV